MILHSEFRREMENVIFKHYKNSSVTYKNVHPHEEARLH